MSDLIEKNNLYVITYPAAEECLCRLEMKCLFQKDIKENYFFSDRNIDPARSPYIRHVLSIMYQADSLEALAGLLRENEAAFGNFKFAHFKAGNGELGYREWIDSVTILGAAIDGETDMHSPSIVLGAIKINGIWIFGHYRRNDNAWMDHNKKPHTNSHSIGLVPARALVNIALGGEPARTLVDPCCGVGTVVIEALSMGINIKAYELNGGIAEKARLNLEALGLSDVITSGDMHGITENFDAAIVDIPYGLFTPVTREGQVGIIKTARRISRRAVILTCEDMDGIIAAEGFKIVDGCHIDKGNFRRYVRVCK